AGAAAGTVFVVVEDSSVAWFTGAGAAAGAVLVVAAVVLEVPPFVVGEVGVGVPVSTGAAVSAPLAPLSERGTASFAGAGPVPVVSIPRLPDPPFVTVDGPVRLAFAFLTNSTALVCGGSTTVGSPTLAAEETSGRWCMKPIA